MRGAGVVLLMFVALGFLAGFGVCQWVSHKPEPSAVATSHQPEVRVSPGNVTAARDPVKKAEPAAPVPKGATVTRTAHVVVKPKPVNHFADAEEMVCECEPVRVDLTQFNDDTGDRLKFTSPDGEILEASDKPIIGEIAGAPRRNALGVTWRPEVGGNNVYGVLYQRDVWERVRVGAKAEHDPLSGVQGEIQALFTY